MHKKLTETFYQNFDVLRLSKQLLGKYLATSFEGKYTAGMIVETEAYRGPDDKACHAHLNRFTKRTKVMFEPGGVAYIYLCYGIHHLFNIVTANAGEPHAILVRAIDPTEGIETMLNRRKMSVVKPQLTAGPGVLTQALGIKKQYSGISLVEQGTPIWIEDRGNNIAEDQIIASPRVGIDYAEECALWDWRFRVKNSKWTSKAK